MENEITRHETWWNRNWKWFVPTGCLSLIIIAAFAIGGIFYGVTSMMKDSDVYQHTIETAQKNPEVASILGGPIEADGMTSGNINVSDNSGQANLNIPVKGSKGRGFIQVIASKNNNNWDYQQMVFYPEDESAATVNLLEKEK